MSDDEEHPGDSLRFLPQLGMARQRADEAISSVESTYSPPQKAIWQHECGSDPTVLEAELELRRLARMLEPYQLQIQNEWTETTLATVAVPVGLTDKNASGLSSTPDVQWQQGEVVGLQSLSQWRYRTAERPSTGSGYDAGHETTEERYFMPPALMDGALSAIDRALQSLNWLPDARTGDYSANDQEVLRHE